MVLRTTEDGSKTVYSERFNQHYHSVFGAKTESQRVFIELGLEEAAKRFEKITILEVGFGTALNAFLSMKKAENLRIKMDFVGVEAFPITSDIIENLPAELQGFHTMPWSKDVVFSEYFSCRKHQATIQDFKTNQKFNLIYFDAFAPESQPEMWTEDIFRKMYDLLIPGGILTTYCSKVLVQRNLRAAGFEVEKHKGPPHKREVLRAVKPG